MSLHLRRTVLVVAILGSCFLLFTGGKYGLVSEVSEVEPNRCSVKGLFPSYVKVSMDHESRFAGKYELYLYSDESIRRASVRIRCAIFFDALNEIHAIYHASFPLFSTSYLYDRH